MSPTLASALPAHLTLASGGWNAIEAGAAVISLLLIAHGVLTIVLAAVYLRSIGPMGKYALGGAIALSAAAYVLLALEYGANLSGALAENAAYFPFGALAMLSPLSIFFLIFCVIKKPR